MTRATTRTPESRFYTIQGLRLHVAHWPGEGDPFLLLHATGFHSRCWDRIVQQLPASRPVYAVDLPCHGLSEALPPPVSWEQVGALLAELLQELDLQRVLVSGHSFGGHLALRLAALQPARFRGLLLLDPVVPEPSLLALWQQFGGLSPVARRRNVWASAEEMFDAFAHRAPYDTWHREVLRDYCQHGLIPAAEGGHLQLACPPACEASLYGNTGSESLYPLLSQITSPVRILRARQRREDDSPFDFRPSPTWPALASQLSQAEDYCLDDLDHFFPMSQPALVAGQLRDVDGRW